MPGEIGTVNWLPHLAPEVLGWLRVAYGLLLAGTIAGTLPHRGRFFLSERWGGYGRSSPSVDAVQNPVLAPIVAAVWLGGALLLVAGVWTPWAALVTVVISRYYFIQMRWHGVLRGMGAPGFVTYWLGAAVFILEWTRVHAPSLQPLAVLVLQADLGCILLIAGFYKLSAGYASNEGMEFGLVNPSWGRWWKRYSAVAPGHVVFRVLNHAAWSTEILIGVLALVPAGRPWAGLVLLVSFAFIATQIRLALLCPMMMTAALVYVPHDSWFAAELATRLSGFFAEPSSGPPLLAGAGRAAGAAMVAYLAMLPVAYGGLLYNFYRRQRIWWPLQRVLDTYTNFFGMILWRVFSADVTNFYVLIHEAPGNHDERRLISRYPGLTPGGAPPAAGAQGRRFGHVAESIAIATIFTTLKYYPTKRALFVDRLLRYARTLPLRQGGHLVFEYIAIRKAPGGFRHEPVSEFVVDPASRRVEERALEPAPPVRAAADRSPVFAGMRPGSYAPQAG